MSLLSLYLSIIFHFICFLSPTLGSSLFLKHTKCDSPSGIWHLLFPLPENILFFHSLWSFVFLFKSHLIWAVFLLFKQVFLDLFATSFHHIYIKKFKLHTRIFFPQSPNTFLYIMLRYELNANYIYFLIILQSNLMLASGL